MLRYVPPIPTHGSSVQPHSTSHRRHIVRGLHLCGRVSTCGRFITRTLLRCIVVDCVHCPATLLSWPVIRWMDRTPTILCCIVVNKCVAACGGVGWATCSSGLNIVPYCTATQVVTTVFTAGVCAVAGVSVLLRTYTHILTHTT
jgi:hypothetical protein